MKFFQFIFLALFGIMAGANSQIFYDINTINTIEITFEESNWDYLLDQMAAAGNEERLMGSVTINGQVFDSVGVRYKGNSSYNSNQVKNPFNIKLDYIIEDQEVDGYGTLKLANGFKDPSMVREAMSYDIARKYFPASQANYANMHVNGTLIGIYTSVQDVDRYFMRTHLHVDDGARIKGEISFGGGPPSGAVWKYYGIDSTDYFDYYVLESDIGWTEFIQFLDTLNNHNDYVDKVLNIDRHLWFLAFANLMVNLDGPINNPQNHYIFKDEAGLFNPIPWDLNENFGVFRNLQGGGNLSTYQLQHFSPFTNLTSSDHPIISKILSNETYSKIYIAHMKTMLEENFSNGWYETRALEIQDIIDADVQADPNKLYTYSNFLSNINSSVGGGPMAVIGITQLMETRISYLSGLAEFQAQAPEISNVDYNPELVTPGTEVWFNAEVEETNQVFLGYRHSITNVFEKTEMFDDGDHQEGAANDGIYGVSILAENSSIQYYIYAENENASAFSPVRAEYEFYTVPVTSDLVINEFMADNETTVTDQDGEFDDWIEFYNNGIEEISLSGYYLTDDASDLTQWTFPDTTIAPDAYLMVWADNDEEQEGLHANFKLSSSGESILLTDSGLNILDEVSFGQQYADTTTGRFPNGTGDFILMNPTFGMENDLGITSIRDIEKDDLISFIAYPNPFTDKINISFNLERQAMVELKVQNLYGQSIKVLTSKSYPEGNNELIIEAEDLPSGIWVFSLVVEGEVYNLKLLKF